MLVAWVDWLETKFGGREKGLVSQVCGKVPWSAESRERTNLGVAWTVARLAVRLTLQRHSLRDGKLFQLEKLS